MLREGRVLSNSPVESLGRAESEFDLRIGLNMFTK